MPDEELQKLATSAAAAMCLHANDDVVGWLSQIGLAYNLPLGACIAGCKLEAIAIGQYYIEGDFDRHLKPSDFKKFSAFFTEQVIFILSRLMLTSNLPRPDEEHNLLVKELYEECVVPRIAEYRSNLGVSIYDLFERRFLAVFNNNDFTLKLAERTLKNKMLLGVGRAMGAGRGDLILDSNILRSFCSNYFKSISNITFADVSDSV